MKGKLKGLSFFLGLVLISVSLNAAAQTPAVQSQPIVFRASLASAHSAGEASFQIAPTPTPAPRSRLSGDAGGAASTPTGHIAADVSAQTCTNLLQDPGFEADVSNNPYWGETSTNFGTPLCTPGSCGAHPNAAPRTGNGWAWFGGIPAPVETATLTQTVTFVPSTTTLDFYFWIGSAAVGSDANDRFNVYIDSTSVFTATALQAGSYPTYTLVSLNMAAFANGSPHIVRFAATTTDQQVDFNLDDVSLCSDVSGGSTNTPTQTNTPSGPTNTPTRTNTPVTPTPTNTPSGNFEIYLPVAMNNYAPIDLSVSRVEVIQGITMGDSYTVHIANRPAFFRAFLNLSGPTSLGGVSGRLTRYVGGVAQDSLSAGPITAQSVTNEGNLSHTLNFSLPANWLVPGTAYVFQVDPLDSILETNEGNNRYPAGSGQQSFNFVNADPLQVVIVPVTYARPGISPTYPETSNLSYLTWMPIKVYPVSTINYTLHVPYTTNQDLRTYTGWSNLLNEITNLHDSEGNADKVYYGVVNFYSADGCSSGCITGIGWIGPPTASAIGFSGWGPGTTEASETFTHEMGHNFNRPHAPCGNPGGPDPSYPYSGGGIGQWGYDVFTGALYNPSTTKDYMSYCDPAWTSDYTYKRIYDYRVSASYDIASPEETQDAFYLSGFLDDQGHAQVGPLYRQTAPVPLEPAAGTHRVELLDASGKVLAARAFNLTSIAFDTSNSGGEGQGFSVFMPAMTGVEALRIYAGNQLLFERSVTGPAPAFDTARSAGSGSVEWTLRAGSASAVYRLRFSPDGGATWQVLALEYKGNTFTVPASLLTNATQPLVEVQAVDGVRTDTRLISLNVRRP